MREIVRNITWDDETMTQNDAYQLDSEIEERVENDAILDPDDDFERGVKFVCGDLECNVMDKLESFVYDYDLSEGERERHRVVFDAISEVFELNGYGRGA